MGAPNMNGNATLIIFGGYSPRNRLALLIVGLGSSAWRLIWLLAGLWNGIYSMESTKGI
jgi:hypothetical protein